MEELDDHFTGQNKQGDRAVVWARVRAQTIHLRHQSHFREYQLTPAEARALAAWLNAAAHLTERHEP